MQRIQSRLIQNRILNYSRRQLAQYFSSKPVRGEYKKLEQADINYFWQILDQNEIIEDQNDLVFYNTDWLNKYIGQSKLALKPKTVEKISEIVSYCNKQRIGIVPQGGNTGLVGSSVPVYDEIIVSLQNLNRIIEYNQETCEIVCEAGCILQTVEEYLQERGNDIPLDLGAKGSCFIGGNTATNAGGLLYVKYGPLRGYVQGIEFVTGSGEIINLLNPQRHDAIFTQLLVGSEGTLGIITKVKILCPFIERNKTTILFKVQSFEDILKLHKLLKKQYNSSIAVLEYFDSFSFKAVLDNVSSVINPFLTIQEITTSNNSPFYLLTELSSGSQASSTNTAEKLFNEACEYINIIDAVEAKNEEERRNLWKIRETIGQACSSYGLVFKYDISLDITQMDQLTQIVRNKTQGLGYTVGYGHIGDGNMHINVSCLNKNYSNSLEDILEPFIFDWIRNIKGSISAEHGLGLMKGQYLHYAKTHNVIKCMKGIKTIFDPNHILNPYKVLP